MAVTLDNFKKGLAVLWATFPSIKPNSDSEFILRVWLKAFSRLTDEQFLNGIQKFVFEIKKLYPSDNWIAILLDICKPKLRENANDVTRLIMDTISNYNYYDPEGFRNSLNKLKKQSPIAYATGERLGWTDMVQTSNMEVLRGQIFRSAEMEIKRANETGIIQINASGSEVVLLSEIQELNKIEYKGE